VTSLWQRRGGWVVPRDWERRLGVFAAVSTRALGDMKDPENFSRGLRDVGRDPDRWAGGRQVHGRRVAVVQRSRPVERAATDGVITGLRDVTLRVFTADCVPVFLVDPVQRALGLVHAGWRGVRNGIVGVALERLKRNFRSRLGDVHVSLGPHVRPCCYEVGPEVVDVFKGTPGAVGGGKGRLRGRSVLNLDQLIRAQVVRAGVLPRRVTSAPWCTVCDPAFYSFRRDRTDERQVALLGAKDGLAV
jgi:YfiH family protein